MLIKAGVDISRLKPPIRKKLQKIANIMWNSESLELIITSTYEGTHSEGSLHYANLAIDIRQKPKSEAAFQELKRYLGQEYDLVLHTDHIHIEYDPK